MGSSLVTIERVRFEFAGEVLCTQCHAALDRHQPDVERPGRLLGTCQECGSWYLIDADAGVMFLMPDSSSLHGV